MSELLGTVTGLIAVLALACASGLTTYGVLGHLNAPHRVAQKRLRQLQGEGERVLPTSSGIFTSVQQALKKLGSLIQYSGLVKRILLPRITRQREEALREQCLNDLPEMIDILSLALGAGLSFDQAFESYLQSFDTPLAKEFAQAQQAVQVGMSSRIRAFEDVASRLQEETVVRFVAALRQAFTLGSPLAPTLDTLAFETRRYRKARLEERIAKTPVKMLIPLGACIVPAVLILLMGPVMTQVISGLTL